MSDSPDPLRVLLTGAAGGLGPFLAEALAGTGASLVLSARPDGEEGVPGADGVGVAELDGLAERLSAGRGKVAVVPADLRDPAAPGRLVERAEASLGGIDVLVHNAGLESVGRYEERTEESVEAVMRVNLLSAMELTRRLVPGMLERGWGRLVYMSSLSARAAPPYAAAYSASKAGLLALGRSLRSEYRGRGIGVTVVLPGFVAGVGMYERGRREAGYRDSRVLGTVTAESVARGVVRALEANPPELLVQRGPTRLALALAELFPRALGDRLNAWAGSERIFREWAEARARREGEDR